MRLKIVVLGTGYWGKNLLRNVDALGCLYGFCDTSEAARKTYGGLYPSARTYDDPGTVFADPEVDAVMIATPAVTHGELARKAILSGKHVFVEKPLCLDLDEARALTELSLEKGVTLMVGHLLLYHPAFVALREFVRAGGIGDIRYIYSNRASLGKIRTEESALWSFAPHDISMILNLIGALPEDVQSRGNGFITPQIADVCLTSLSFAGGVGAHIFVSWLHPYKDHKLVIVGSTGMAVFDDVAKGGEKLLVWPHQVTTGERQLPPSVDRAQAKPIPYDAEAEPLRQECEHFIRSAESGSKPVSDGEEAERVLQVLAAAQASMERGGESVACDAATLKSLSAQPLKVGGLDEGN
ncbi:MAG: Gfo/Idh/MocA family oxidoreductase [Alphaproteobacteria bacterium]|nr:Gfo/Idh/MocA family oxidoreductase [Alphaproteobacteria bacterium]MBO6861290.1 Gfo/Idh/MocA family oxidoreductase [Alphaproteobacteria bacterium]